jgi:hypothetical protein
MAIKVNGTTVIDDSRNLSNVGGLKTVGGNNLVGSGDVGFKTVNGSSVVGSGNISAGASTTNGAVGTYTWGRPQNMTNYTTGSTASSVRAIGGDDVSYAPYFYTPSFDNAVLGTLFSGTWRCMSVAPYYSPYAYMGLWVRIS